ncbi:hypothetical protein [Variovorax sp. JS1663]|uniref:hypothetical protein n=1 Tax=Variovorax sp. JS1663 TaxID=1851577 RepID=UPI000B349BB3|nr:hypothetical protein [Variovorax sp. JS1663]OUM00762.1 hypothetical protein A8M77_19950 [Variovorax sp. JS1663]
MSQSDDVLDFRVRFHRDESPMLFRAIAGLEAAPGMRKRNLFVRQLMEMGLMVMEERMRRQDGLSTRVSSGLADEVSASAGTMARASGRPAAIQSASQTPVSPGTDRAASADPGPDAFAKTPVATSPATTPSEAGPPALTPAPAPAARIVAIAAPVDGNVPPGDDDRPPPRLGGARAVRMLDGESFE